jgi:hypothetical protein
MDLRLTASGRIFHQVDSTLAAILIEAFPASFERLNQPERRQRAAHVPATPGLSTHAAKFSVGGLPSSGEPVITATDGRTVLHYTGAPENSANFVFFGLIEGPTKAPDHIVAEYKALCAARPELDKWRDAGLKELLTHVEKTPEPKFALPAMERQQIKAPMEAE